MNKQEVKASSFILNDGGIKLETNFISSDQSEILISLDVRNYFGSTTTTHIDIPKSEIPSLVKLFNELNDLLDNQQNPVNDKIINISDKLKLFLIKEGIYDRVVELFKPKRELVESLEDAFNWSNTDEGTEYWLDLFYKFNAEQIALSSNLQSKLLVVKNGKNENLYGQLLELEDGYVFYVNK